MGWSWAKLWWDETYGLEGRDLGLLRVVGEAVLHVVDGHAAVGTIEADVGNLGHAVVGAVPGLEKDHGGPVVGKVVGHLASGAVGHIGHDH